MPPSPHALFPHLNTRTGWRPVRAVFLESSEWSSHKTIGLWSYENAERNNLMFLRDPPLTAGFILPDRSRQGEMGAQDGKSYRNT